MFEFISAEQFPGDNYIKEIVYFSIDGKIRVAYVRKNSQRGESFWSPMAAGVSKEGSKKYYDAFLFDSNFLQDDIKDFLYKRKWEKNVSNGEKINDYPDNLPF